MRRARVTQSPHERQRIVFTRRLCERGLAVKGRPLSVGCADPFCTRPRLYEKRTDPPPPTGCGGSGSAPQGDFSASGGATDPLHGSFFASAHLSVALDPLPPLCYTRVTFQAEIFSRGLVCRRWLKRLPPSQLPKFSGQKRSTR